MSKHRKPGDLVSVSWRDSHLLLGWRDPVSVRAIPASRMTSVGYVVEHTRRRIAVAGSLDRNGDVAGVVIIPAGQVVKVRRFR